MTIMDTGQLEADFIILLLFDKLRFVQIKHVDDVWFTKKSR